MVLERIEEGKYSVQLHGRHKVVVLHWDKLTLYPGLVQKILVNETLSHWPLFLPWNNPMSSQKTTTPHVLRPGRLGDMKT